MGSCQNILAITSTYIVVVNMTVTKENLLNDLKIARDEAQKELAQLELKMDAVNLRLELTKARLTILKKTITKAQNYETIIKN